MRVTVLMIFSTFFFQPEDGIRDADVTGVQTCALPICCLDEDGASYCFWIQEKNMNNNSKIINYYNKDTIIIASGYMVKGKPHGVFKIYCPSFPYCDINEIQDHSIADIVYSKGKILAEFYYNKGEVLVRKKSIFFGRKTRRVIIGEISDRKARKFFRKNGNLE